MSRKPFDVTDDDHDAPDGAAIELEDGKWERVGDKWVPRELLTETPEEWKRRVLSNCSCDQRGRNVSCERCRP